MDILFALLRVLDVVSLVGPALPEPATNGDAYFQKDRTECVSTLTPGETGDVEGPRESRSSDKPDCPRVTLHQPHDMNRPSLIPV